MSDLAIRHIIIEACLVRPVNVRCDVKKIHFHVFLSDN